MKNLKFSLVFHKFRLLSGRAKGITRSDPQRDPKNHKTEGPPKLTIFLFNFLFRSLISCLRASRARFRHLAGLSQTDQLGNSSTADTHSNDQGSKGGRGFYLHLGVAHPEKVSTRRYTTTWLILNPYIDRIKEPYARKRNRTARSGLGIWPVYL